MKNKLMNKLDDLHYRYPMLFPTISAILWVATIVLFCILNLINQ